MHDYALPGANLAPSHAVRASELEEAALHGKADFARRVHELNTTLIGILSDTSKLLSMRQTSDPESIQDLIWGIARGYASTPDLRLAWLDALIKEHAANDNLAEAGMCAVHSALLISQFLVARDGADAPVLLSIYDVSVSFCRLFVRSFVFNVER